MADKKGNEEKKQGELPLEDTTPDYEQQIKDFEQQEKDFKQQLKDANNALKDIEKNRKKQSPTVWSIEKRDYVPNEKRISDEEYENAKKKVAEIQEALNTAKASKKKAKDGKLAQDNERWEQALKQTGLDGSQRGGILGVITGGFQETPAQKEKREAGLQERQETQKEDVEDLKEEGEDIVDEQREASESDANKNLESLESLVRERIEGAKNDPIYNELPRTIRQAYKAGEFGDPVNEDIRKAYRAEMKKPKKERNAEVIEDYKKELERTKDARNAKNWYTMNAIGTALLNVGTALKGGTPTAETEWNKRQGARIANAQQRYKDLLDAKANTVIDELKNKQGFDQSTQKAIRSLYNDRRLQPILNRLDTDSQIQLIDLMQEQKDAINFNAFVNALVMSLVKNPEGAVSTALGVGKDVIDLVK